MPELPEMENYKNVLKDKIANQVVTDVQINREKSININPDLFKKTVQHQQIVDINRRGKHLLFQLKNEQTLLLHLMLGGWMFYGSESEKPNRTIQVRLSFGQKHLYFIGLRLGYLHLYNQTQTKEKLSDLGPEPLNPEFTVNEFLKRIASKHGRLKTTLLDQSFIAGIGNCYSAEICFQAGIKPTKNIDDINRSDRSRLYDSMKNVLQDGIMHCGYMDNPIFQGDTLTGGFNNRCKVYDREGQPCYRCGATIVIEVISSRKTYYCPNCQR
ncbi:bifunctional DNA-formamidopyrimidine glycosylase/DNA-(apurinic or apyrimidinic site) lyase [Neobacillus cucumis]|uniref:bifunctional DNA-formamidopyrimidine glycosylase/DNA-(apurinic or apyrimidinic site) lyase n=1 Tax=Neobacillus cucumis TaxID=1740721 RepID=UPI00204184B0|nr:bifunctional DNA-formamidopyrimidine glycosylase/DNA-(apurinic or apyrimidinic site) lyase [Neobacillus cucumis]MCM3729445.1 bifunctional DNA-formamidopyrimidine glycosylase/DNA-(apurinic or apyrimidinic site) lyase [Neobacillus cucumis]